MQHLPKILKIRRNSGPSVSGSFIDDSWVWHYIAAGAWEFQMAGKTWQVSVGDSVLIPPRLLHVVKPVRGEKLLHEVIHFSLPRLYGLGDYAYVLTLPKLERKRVRRWFRELERLWRDGIAESGTNDGLMLEVAGLSTAILGVHRRHEQHARATSSVNVPGWHEVEQAVHFLQKNFMRADITLAEIGRAAGVTPNYLCRIFMGNMGCTVMNYLSTHRMEHAEMLLLTTTLNCSQVAEQTGFSGLHVFSHAFRRLRGESPSQFRAKHAPNSVG